MKSLKRKYDSEATNKKLLENLNKDTTQKLDLQYDKVQKYTKQFQSVMIGEEVEEEAQQGEYINILY